MLKIYLKKEDINIHCVLYFDQRKYNESEELFKELFPSISWDLFFSFKNLLYLNNF